MTYRKRIVWRGRTTNRINCPQSLAERGVKVISFDECKECPHAKALGYRGVNCDYGESTA